VAYESAPSLAHFTGFAGGHVDAETGLVNDYQRWYDPAAGRWLSQDRAGFAAGDANLDRYVGNGPTGAIDLTGLSPNPTNPPGYPPNWDLAWQQMQAQAQKQQQQQAALQQQQAAAQQLLKWAPWAAAQAEVLYIKALNAVLSANLAVAMQYQKQGNLLIAMKAAIKTQQQAQAMTSQVQALRDKMHWLAQLRQWLMQQLLQFAKEHNIE
jgi:RHS repeat-associated protein